MRRTPIVCPTCKTLHRNRTTYCPTCQTTRDRARPTPEQRGYGPRHRALRRRWQHRIRSGETPPCPKCGHPITPTTPWDLGHTDDRDDWTGPEHATCNRADGGRRGAHATNTRHN